MMLLVVIRRDSAVLTHEGNMRAEGSANEFVRAFFVPSFEIDGYDKALDLIWGDVSDPFLGVT